MKAFEVRINEEVMFRAGATEDGNLSAHLIWYGMPFSGKVSLHVLGTDPESGDQLEWPTPRLGEGDRLTISIVNSDADALDRPSIRHSRTVRVAEGLPPIVLQRDGLVSSPQHQADKSPKQCSFCDQPESDSRRILGSTTAACICNQCVAHFNEAAPAPFDRSQSHLSADDESVTTTDPGRQRRK